jgi:hypothetical protein
MEAASAWRSSGGRSLKDLAVGPAAVALLVAAHLTLVVHGATRHSATSDEVVYAAAGAARLLAGAPDLNPEHPPLLKLLLGASWLGADLPKIDAVPGLAEGDQWHFGHVLTYGSPESPQALLLRARLVVATLSALLALAVWAVARRVFGPLAGILALALYAFDPLVVSYAGLATLDLGSTAAIFAAACAAAWALAPGGWGRVALAGLLLGAALAMKLNALVVWPVLGLLTVAPWLGGSGVEVLSPRLVRGSAIAIIAGVACSLACLPEGPSAWWRAFELQRQHAGAGHPSFAFGQYSTTGWWWYFPVAWAVKTPIPLLLATAAGAAGLVAGARRRPVVAVALLAVPVLLLAVLMLAPICIGVRYLLPATPFLAAAGGAALERLWRPSSGPIWVGALLLWTAAGTLAVHPSELAYANEAAGGPASLYLRLSDSNVDWGQDLPALADELRGRKVRRLWLDYFGPGLPAAHGIQAYRMVRGINLGVHPRGDGPDPEGADLIAVSAFQLLDVPYPDHTLHAWLRARRPIAFPGHSIALYDLTGDPEAYRQLALMAMRLGDQETASEAMGR